VKIKVKASGLRIASIIFTAESGEEISLVGTNNNGNWSEFNLKPEERLIGCCGYLSGSKNLVGVGFIVWAPY
jgi:hypothetical protein